MSGRGYRGEGRGSRGEGRERGGNGGLDRENVGIRMRYIRGEFDIVS